MIDVKYIHTHTYTYGYKYMYTSKHRGIFHIHNTFNGYSFIFFDIVFYDDCFFSPLFFLPFHNSIISPSFLLLPFLTPFLFLYMYIIRFTYIFNMNSIPLIYCAVFTIFSPPHYFLFFILSFHSFIHSYSHSLVHSLTLFIDFLD